MAAMIYPNWALLHEQGIEPHQALDFIWERIKEAQKNLAVFKRLKRKEAITIVGQPFAKSTKQGIKRHLYVSRVEVEKEEKHAGNS